MKGMCPMLEFEILDQGIYDTSNVVVTYDPVNSRMDLDVQKERMIKASWDKHKSWAKEFSLDVKNENILRLKEFVPGLGDPKLELEVGLTNYKEFSGTRSVEASELFGRWNLSNPLGASIVLNTSDNKILCGKRPPNTNMNPNRYFVFGGFLTPEDFIEDPSLFTGIVREVIEETGISVNQLTELECTGLVYDTVKPHPELCFSARVLEVFSKVKSLKSKDIEINELEFIDNTKQSILDWLLGLHPNGVVGTAEACLLLHGKSKFGQNWFQKAKASLKALS